MRALWRGSTGTRVFARVPSNVPRVSEGSALSPILNERWGPNAPLWRPGDQVSLALRLGGPQYPALQCQDPWEGPFGADLWLGLAPGGRLARAEGCAVSGGRVEVRALGMGTWA